MWQFILTFLAGGVLFGGIIFALRRNKKKDSPKKIADAVKESAKIEEIKNNLNEKTEKLNEELDNESADTVSSGANLLRKNEEANKRLEN
jgi:hypothetical protein